jgi:DNA-binding transcriptional LysR family regulator
MDWAERIGHRIKLRDLHILRAVAQWGSMAKAANRLSVSHPVISKTISDLEHTLGVRLLDRSSQGVEPTVYGRALLKCGTAVFDEMRQGLKEIEFLTNANSEELRIGCPEAMAAGLLPSIVEQFSRQCPGARLHAIYADTANSQFDELRERNVDLLIGTIPRPFFEDDLIAASLFDERFVVVAGVQSPLVRRRRTELSDLVNEPWILPPFNSVPGRLIVEIFAANKLQVPLASMVNLSIHLTTALVATGRFIALLPGSVARLCADRLSLTILPVKLPAQPITVGIVTVKNRTVGALAQLFIDCARKVALPLTKISRTP